MEGTRRSGTLCTNGLKSEIVSRFGCFPAVFIPAGDWSAIRSLSSNKHSQELKSSPQTSKTMIIVPLLGLLALTLLAPWICVFVADQFPQLETSISQLIQNLVDPAPPKKQNTSETHFSSQSTVLYDPLRDNHTSYTVLSNDLVHDFESFFQQNKAQLSKSVSDLYQKYVPERLVALVEDSLDFWKAHSSYRVYKDHEEIVNNILIILGALLTIRLTKSLISSIFSRSDSQEEFVMSDSRPQSSKSVDYLPFETIPMCVGKGDAEELLVLQSYEELSALKHDSKILKQFDIATEEYRDEISSKLTSSTRISLDGPVDVTTLSTDSESLQISESTNNDHLDTDIQYKFPTSSSPSSNSNDSPSPEDSFERQERKLDKNLSNLNRSNAPESVSMTPTSSSVLEFTMSTSPTRKLVYKQSFSLLSGHSPTPASASATIGDITQETVYSEPFSSDDSASSPIRLKNSG